MPAHPKSRSLNALTLLGSVFLSVACSAPAHRVLPGGERDAARSATLAEDWSVAAENWSLRAFRGGEECTSACLEAARAFSKLSDNDSAQSMLEFGLVHDPDNPDLHEALGDLMAGQGFHRAAQRNYEAVLELDPGRPSVCLKLARLRLELGLETSALALLDQLISMDQACPETWYLRGAACQARGDYSAAWESFERAFESPGADPVRQLAAARFFFTGPGSCVPRARKGVRIWLEPVIVADPQNSEALYIIGTLDREQGDLMDALGAFRRAVEIDPTSFTYVEALGEAYLEVGERERARDMLERAQALDPKRSVRLERLFEQRTSG